MKQAASGSNQPFKEDVLYSKEQRRSSVTRNSAGDRKYSATNEEKQKSSSRGCYRCGKPGHIKRDYRVKVSCDRCGKHGHVKANCRVKMQEAGANVVHESSGEQANWEKCLSIEVSSQASNVTSVLHPTDANAAAHSSIDYTREWIVDSGCSHHATGNIDLLLNVRPHCGNYVIVTADNSLHPVIKEGFYKEDNSEGVRLDDVYHVPGLKKNLASVSQITNSGRYVLFGPDNVQVLSNVDHISADVLLTGKRKESLYVLSANEAYVEKTSRNVNSTLWHARLGHVGY